MKTTKRSATWYEQVLDSMSDLVLVKGDRSRLLWANKAFLDYYGMSAEELEDIIDAPHVDPDDTVQYVKDDHRVFTTGQTLEIPSEPITDSHGRVAYFHTVKDAVRDADGAVIQTVGVSRRIRDRGIEARSVEDRAERKERLHELRTLVRSIPLAVAMFDIRNRFVCHSESWRELFQCDERALLGEFYDAAFERCVALEAAMSRASLEGQSAHLEAVPMRGFRGGHALVDIELRPWFFPSGEVGGVIVLLHDVTRIKETQGQLERLNSELLQFNYRVSHDLLAPLRTVRGFVELCQDELDDGNLDEVRTYHQMILESVERLGGLVEDVLDLARADMADLAVETVALDPLVSDILAKHRRDIDAADMQVVCEFGVAEVRSQRVRVLQVLENLIANAIKYHDPAANPRHLRVTSSAAPDGAVLVRVADNGIGFDEQLADAIFEIFKRGTSKYPGSGLGLYIARKHMERLHGTVRAVSCRHDTIFEVMIPNAGRIASTSEGQS